MARVVLENVSKVFGDVRAVDHIDLTVKDGEFMVVVGLSGCGKSTLLRLLAGLEELTVGDIYIGDDLINHKTPQERNVAMVFQNYALYPHKTVRKNLDFPLRMMGAKKQERQKRIKEAAEKLDIVQFLDRKPTKLSGGQQQRVSMGRAIVRNPEAFLMDEPLSNLDAKLRAEIRTEISDLQRELGITTIYVTHDQVEAMTLGDRIAVLLHGELLQVAGPKELYNRPVNTFVASFIGGPSMNIFESRISRHDDQLKFEFGRQKVPIDSRTVGDIRDELDQDILLGLRPEVFVEKEKAGADQRIEVTVHTTEELGHERIVYFQVPVNKRTGPADHSGQQGVKNRDGATSSSVLTARLAAGKDTLKKGEKFELGIDTKQLHFFDRDGKAIYGRER